MKIKAQRGYSPDISLSSKFITYHCFNITKNALVIYLHILLYYSNGEEFELADLSEKLNVKVDDVLDAVSELQKEGLIKLKADVITLINLSDKSQKQLISNVDEYTPEEISLISETDFSLVRDATEKAFSKLLSVKDVNRLAEIFNWLNLPGEVVVILIEYVAKTGKKSLAYVEKVAIDWSEKGINTLEKAHNYISVLEARNTLVSKIRSKFMMFDRPVSKKDREFLDAWQKNYTEEQIFAALEITINSTSKLSFSYADKVLKNAGIDISASKKANLPKGKFNNFTQKKQNYDDIEKRAMEKLLGLTKK